MCDRLKRAIESERLSKGAGKLRTRLCAWVRSNEPRLMNRRSSRQIPCGTTAQGNFPAGSDLLPVEEAPRRSLNDFVPWQFSEL